MTGNLQCEGTEKDISECISNTWLNYYSMYNNDKYLRASVKCSGKLITFYNNATDRRMMHYVTRETTGQRKRIKYLTV